MKIINFILASSLVYTVLFAADEREDLFLDLKYSKDLGVNTTQVFADEITPPKPILQPVYKSPGLSVCLSALFPGLGHVYLGDLKTASGLLGSTGVSLSGCLFTKKDFQKTSFQALDTTWSYGIYAAYRDARLNNQYETYYYKMPTDSFVDLSMAPFRISVLKKPEVWGGFLGMFALAIATGYLQTVVESQIDLSLSTKEPKYYPAFALPVGVSEEALYRGYLQSQLSEIFSPIGGIAFSSLLFGAAHIGNGLDRPRAEKLSYFGIGIPFITAFGAYLGWVTYKNQSLQQSVAIHTWYDFVVFAMHASSEAAITGRPQFAIAFSF